MLSRTGAKECAELTRLAAEASPATAAALTTARDLIADAMPGAPPLAVLHDDNLWILGPFLRGRLTQQQRAKLAAELIRTEEPRQP